ncbi:hypothetical protein M2C68_22745, partial [Pseudomonas sp. BAgro211]|nr:hypothetical protein [Pseudomonas sp. BAgro211]
DRDGLYGAVKFALACRAAGIRPLFGVDLAVDPAAGGEPEEPGRIRAAELHRRHHPVGRRLPARGGASVDPRLPRVT